MFGFLRRLFGRRNQLDLRNLPAFGRINDQHRAIFRFWDGTKERAVDPLVVWMAIECDPEFVGDRHPAAVDNGNVDASRIMGDMICRAFGVKAFDGREGLTLQERLALWVTFCAYADDLKKNALPSPTPPPVSGATYPEFGTETGQHSSASGSTLDDQRSASQIASA